MVKVRLTLLLCLFLANASPTTSTPGPITTTSIPTTTTPDRTTTPATELPTTSTSTPATTTSTPKYLPLALKVGQPTTTVLESFQALEISIEGPLESTHQFWIFEAHSQYYGISLSSVDSTLSGDRQFSVANHPGVVMLRKDNVTSPKVYLSSKNAGQNVTVLLLVRGYSSDSPVPGLDDDKLMNIRENGEIATAASLNLTWDAHIVRLRFRDAGHVTNGTSQEIAISKSDWIFRYRVYQMFLLERDYDETNYLTQLSGFLTVKDIASSGTLVSETFVRHNSSLKEMEVIFGAYPGTAALYTVVVSTRYPRLTAPNGTELTYSSVYVASSTYACNLNETLPLNCKVMWLPVTKVVCAFSVFIGLFVALVGHRYFQVTQFFFGIFAGYFVAYILVEKYTYLDFTGTLGLSAGVAVLFALVWSFLWFFCGIPLLATLLPTSVLGLLLGCVLVFLPPLNIASMTDDTTYWLSVAALTMGTPLIMLSFTKSASILSCAIVGSYAIITPIDHYIGSNLKYILVNVVRRATVEDFNWAVIQFPFQINDVALLLGWIALVVVSTLVQRVRERNRAPFPPNMYQQIRWRREERSSSNENASNSATETSPLLHSVRSDSRASAPTENQTPSNPRGQNVPRITRTPTSGETPVVGYIERYGSTSMVPSPVYRAVHMPEFYERRTTSMSVQRASAPSKRQQMTPNQNIHEDSDIFRPPDDHQETR